MAEIEVDERVSAEERYEHLAATVRIAVNELCTIAEERDSLPLAESIYQVTTLLERQLDD